jgi:hypothetical protein
MAAIDVKLNVQLNDPQAKPRAQSRHSSRASPRQRLRPASQQPCQEHPRSSRLSQRSAGESAVGANGLSDYIAAPVFSGPVLGYDFKSGPQGLGYYRVESRKEHTAAQSEQPRDVPSRLSSAAASSRAGSRPGTSASSTSLDSEWVYALNSMARNCEIRRQSRMSHRGGNVMTWAEPGTLSPIREKATPSHAADPDAPLGQAGKHPWQPRAPWNHQSSNSTPKHGRRVVQPRSSAGSKGAVEGLGPAGAMRPPSTPGYGKLT